MAGRIGVYRDHKAEPTDIGVRCSCGAEFSSWEDCGRHIDMLLAKPPETFEEAIANMLADHLGDPYESDEGYFNAFVGDDGRFCCKCGWKSSKPDVGEWYQHMSDEIRAQMNRLPQKRED